MGHCDIVDTCKMAIEGSSTFSNLESTADLPASANDTSVDDPASTNADATAVLPATKN